MHKFNLNIYAACGALRAARAAHSNAAADDIESTMAVVDRALDSFCALEITRPEDMYPPLRLLLDDLGHEQDLLADLIADAEDVVAAGGEWVDPQSPVSWDRARMVKMIRRNLVRLSMG